MHCSRLSFELFVVDNYCHKSCYIKCTVKPTRKSDKNHNNIED